MNKDEYMKSLEFQLNNTRMLANMQAQIMRTATDQGKLNVILSDNVPSNMVAFVPEMYTKQDLERVEKEATQRANQIANEYIQLDLVPYLDAKTALISTLTVIDTATSTTLADTRQIENLLSALPESNPEDNITLDVRLAAQFVALTGLSRRAHVNSEFIEAIKPLVASRIEGIQCFKEDKGEYLRRVVQETGGAGFKRLLEIRETFNFGGNPSGPKMWRINLAKHWFEVESDHPEFEYAAEVRDHIIKAWTIESPKPKIMPRADLLLWQRKALESLQKSSSLAASSYRNKLMKLLGDDEN